MFSRLFKTPKSSLQLFRKNQAAMLPNDAESPQFPSENFSSLPIIWKVGLTVNSLARLSTFASKTPAVAGVLLLGLHYTVDFAASVASLEIFGGGWAGNVSPSRSSRIARSGFGST